MFLNIHPVFICNPDEIITDYNNLKKVTDMFDVEVSITKLKSKYRLEVGTKEFNQLELFLRKALVQNVTNRPDMIELYGIMFPKKE